MKKIEVEEMKNISLEILRYVKDVCEKNNIKYFLIGGTLLGAIRHKGYIPWDDDIDICLLKPDYDKLLKIIDKEGVYKVFEPEYVEDTCYFFAKLVDGRTIMQEEGIYQLDGMGVSIDIFPIHGMPDNVKEQNRFIKKLKNYKLNFNATLGDYWCYSPQKIKRVAKFVLRMPRMIYAKAKGKTFWKNKINSLMFKYDIEACDFVGYGLSVYGTREIHNKDIFNETIDVEFEGEIYKAPKEYDKYLTAVYGDYMKLPPESKRVSHHMFSAYWLDKEEK